MRNGEVSLLGGLNQSTDSNTLNGIPGLTNIPVLGKFLFGSTSVQKMSDQIMIAITPHIVRTPDYSPENMRTIYAGSDQNIRVIHEQLPDAAPVILPPAAAKPQAGTPPSAAVNTASAALPGAAAAPANTPASTVAAPATTRGAAPPGANLVAAGPAPAAVPAPNVPAGVTAPPAPGPAPAPTPNPTVPAATARLSFSPGRVQVAPEGSFTLTLQLDGASDLYSASPLQIKFDPAQVRLNDAAAGDLLTRDGVKVTKQQDIRNDAGEATITFTRLPGASGVSGSGALATLSFSAIGRGTGTVSITGASLKNSRTEAAPVALASVPVTVQ
jgi:hypothetical protein